MYCCVSGLLFKSISRGSCLVVCVCGGGFSLVVMCVLLSSCGRIQLSHCGRGLQASCSVHEALELRWGHLCI